MRQIVTNLFFCLLFFGAAAQSYQPVAEKSNVGFSIKNFGVSTGGSFSGLEGTIVFDKASLEKSAFDVTINAASVNTDNSARDNHLRKEEYFDAEKFPKISFKSARISSKGSGYTVSGTLTIKGISKTVSFPFTAVQTGDELQLAGSFQIDRRDFTVGGNSLVLGDKVTVTLKVLAKKK
ncbi:MAG: YceI family protein [Bacteroidota bacterium]|nr:YceI family protein [Bacteroidota bacterium]